MSKQLMIGELIKKNPGDKICLQESGITPDLMLGVCWMQSGIFKCTEKTKERIFFEIIDKSRCVSNKLMNLFILGEGHFYLELSRESKCKDKYDMFSKAGTKCNIYEVD